MNPEVLALTNTSAYPLLNKEDGLIAERWPLVELHVLALPCTTNGYSLVESVKIVGMRKGIHKPAFRVLVAPA